jgi:phosphoserine phosphatase RsbU/P
MPSLVILQGPDPGRQFSLDHDTAIIGRQPDAAVYLESLAVSRQHAQILCQNGDCFVEDLGSSNGTFVNGQQLTGRVPLTEHDTLQIGPYLMVIRPDSPLGRDSDPAIRLQVNAVPSNLTLYSQNPSHKLQVVLEISQHLARTLEVEPLLSKLLDQLLVLFPQADRGIALLVSGDNLEVKAQRSRRPNVRPDALYSRTLVQRAMNEGIGILSEDVLGDKTINKTATLVALNLRSLICVPMITQDGRRLGVIQLECRRADMRFVEDDLEMLTAIGLQAAVVLDNVELHAERLQEERLHQELILARDIQQGFLPKDFKPGGLTGFELFARVYPARQVSGDLYDFFPLTDGRLAFFLGDVSGKGMPAALFMIAVRTLGRHLAHATGSPAETLRKLNDALAADNPSAMFVTLAHGIYDPRNGEIVLASGGHPAPLIRANDGRVTEMELRNGRLLGYQGGDLGLADFRLQLATGETLIFYTDGFTEAHPPDSSSLFGIDRLKETLGGSITFITLENCAEHAKNEVQAFIGGDELQDDLTMLLLRRV